MSDVFSEFTIPGIELIKTGKVRRIYRINQNSLLIVTSDRISAFDVVLPTAIPEKGALLTQISNFWFQKTSSTVPNHLIETDFDKFPENLQCHRDKLRGRSVIVKELKMLPFEFIVRGYLSGSLWNDYRKGTAAEELKLPSGLKESEKLSSPLFTPTTKAESGHDLPVKREVLVNKLGKEITQILEETAIRLYETASLYAAEKGIIIADTKFEFGLENERPCIADELLTPDSSRFWPAETYQPGHGQESYDKQYVRDYLESIRWAKTPPAPELPEEVIQKTRRKYTEAFEKLTGKPFQY